MTGSGMSRRELIAAVGVGAVTGLSGCGGDGTTADGAPTTDATAEESTTVVFTDSTTGRDGTEAETTEATRTTAGTTESERLVFDGGNAAAFQSALDAAAVRPDATLAIEPGTYRLGRGDSQSGGGIDAHFEQVGLEDVTIEGNGATLVFTDPTAGMLHFYGGGGVTIRDLTLDYDPTPFTQAEVVSFSPNDRRVVVALEDGYPALDHPMFDTEKVWASTHTADGEFVSGIHADKNPDKEFSSVTSLGDRRYELTVRESSNLAGLAEGRRLAIVARAGDHALHFADVAEPTLENVTVRASIAFAIHFAVCTRPVVENCTVGPRRDSGRLIGSDADGIHCLSAREGPRIENCDIHHLEDDGIVVSTEMTSVTEVVSEDTVAVASTYPFTASEGDVFAVLSPSGERRGELPPVAAVDYRFEGPRSPGRPRTVTFESPVADRVAEGDYVLNRATANHGFEVRNNDVRNNRASLVRIASGRGELVGNTLSGSSSPAVELECDTRGVWSPKGWLYDVTVAENTVERSGMNYINPRVDPTAIHVLHRAAQPNEGTPHRDIRIRDNEISDSGGLGVRVEDATSVDVTGNEISNPNGLDRRRFLGRAGYGVGLENVADVTLSGNRVAGASDRLATFGWRADTTGVEASKNTLVVGGESQPPDVVEAASVTVSFSRTRASDGGRHLGFMCFELSLLDADSAVVESVDVGGAEDGVNFASGAYSRASHDGRTWRWLGGPAERAVIQFSRTAVGDATHIRLDGVPGLEDTSARVAVDGEESDPVELGAVDRKTVTLPLP
jgi:hypothetical protein